MVVRRGPQPGPSDLCSAFCSLYIAARGLSSTSAHHADGGSNNATPNPMHSAPPGTTKRSENKIQTDQASKPKRPDFEALRGSGGGRLPPSLKKTAEQRANESTRQAKETWQKEQEKMQRNQKLGGLAKDSIFADEDADRRTPAEETQDDPNIVREDRSLGKRSPSNMAPRIDPRPNARARWARMMVIRNIRHRGRITREMRIARTERSHLSKSQFFKTSLKKLAPLARQIAGKSIDEAIMQMRFSTKKAAREVHKHLIQARNEAVAIRGMGLPDPDAPKKEYIKTEFRHTMGVKDTIQAVANERSYLADSGKMVDKTRSTPLEEEAYNYDTTEKTLSDTTQSTPSLDRSTVEIRDPSNTAPLLTQKPTKALQSGIRHSPTDIYIAEAWVNRGSYGMEASPRARGRQDILRPPHTGISVVLKEEKTRTRVKMEKEIKAIRKRMNGKVWTQLPDRPITRQSQYVLW